MKVSRAGRTDDLMQNVVKLGPGQARLRRNPAEREAYHPHVTVAAMPNRPVRSRRTRAPSQDLSDDDLDSLGPGLVFALNQFEVDELVLVRNVNRKDDFWPAVVVDPIKGVPDSVRRQMQPHRLCAMFFGPAFNKIRPRDFCWAGEGDVLPWPTSIDQLRAKAQNSFDSKGRRDTALSEAIQEALQYERGPVQAPFPRSSLAATAAAHIRPGGPGQAQASCICCGAGLAPHELQIQMRCAGRCTDCQILYEEGSFCPVCDKVWLQTDKNMVGCDNCNFWVHDHCDPVAARVLSCMARGDDDEPYMCPLCRKQEEERSMLAALQHAEATMKAAYPRNPRSAYNIFSLEIHKQYATETGALDGIGYRDMARVVGETWRALTPGERGPYERLALGEQQRYNMDKRNYLELHARFIALQNNAKRAGLLDEAGLPRQQALRIPPPPRSLSNIATRPSLALPHRPSGLGRSVSGIGSATAAASPQAHSHSVAKRERAADPEWEDKPARRPEKPDGDRVSAGKKRPPPVPAASDTPKKQTLVTPRSNAAAGSTEVLQRVPIYCGSTHGIFLLGRQRVICTCQECIGNPEADREFSCTQFEQHAGAGAAKKWKASLRIDPAVMPETTTKSGASMSIGKWLEHKGFEVKPNAAAKPPSGPSASGASTSPAPPSSALAEKERDRDRESKPVKEEKEKVCGPAGPFEPWNDVLKEDFKPIQVRWAGDRCSVCDSDVDFDYDQLVSCDMCGVTVHQSCYGVPELPGVDDMWLCRACELKEEGGKAPQCCLCPISGGALKPATQPGLWCHATCMQWVPEVSVENVTVMEPVTNITSIQKDRWELMCCICKRRQGAKIQCTSCYTAYHPLCARTAGLHMEILDTQEGADGSVRLISYCPRHCTARPEVAGVQIVTKDEGSGDGEGVALWNCQPFRQPPAVPLPDNSCGCARAQPLQKVVRASHGTGIGFSSTAAFWIPGKPPEQTPAPQKPRALGRPPKLPDGSRRGGRKRDAGHLGDKGHGGHADKRARDSDEESEPPEPVDLMPLPPNSAEQIPVICNGRSGILILRTQRVMAGGSEMSASRFETVCGKGDAKKWKCSISTEVQPGIPGETMQDWLNFRKLDRKALGILAANLAAHEAYHEYVAEEVHAIMESMLEILDPEGARRATPPEASDNTVFPAAPVADSRADPTCQISPAQPQQAAHANPLLTMHAAAQPGIAPAGLATRQGTAQPGHVSFSSNTLMHDSNAGAAHWQPSGNASNAARRPKSPWDIPEDEPAQSNSQEAAAPFVPSRTGGASLIQGLSWDRSHTQHMQRDTRGRGPSADGSRASGENGDVLDVDAFIACREGSPDGNSLKAGISQLRNAASELRRLPVRHSELELAAMHDNGIGRLSSDPFLSLPSIGEDGMRNMFRSQGLSWQGSYLGGTGPLEEHFDFMDPSPPGSLVADMARMAELQQQQQQQQLQQPSAAAPAAEATAQQPAANGTAAGMSLRSSSLRKPQPGSATFQRPTAMKEEEHEAKPQTLDAKAATELVRRLCGESAEQPAEAGPQSRIGQRCRVHWPDDDDWYEAVVRDFDPDNGRHSLWYFYDAEMEWLDCAAEERAGRLKWVSKDLPVASSELEAKEASQQEASRPRLGRRERGTGDTGTPGVSVGPEPESKGEELVGRRLGIWWPEDACYYYGSLEEFAEGRHRMHYDDGDTEMLDLCQEMVDWREAPPAPEKPVKAEQEGAGAAAAAEGGEGAVEPSKDVPAHIAVVCNDKRGMFDVKAMCIVMDGGRTVSATEFERLAGKAASKKWKSSIRVDKGKGVPGMTMGDWLVQMGLDQPRSDRAGKGPAAPSMNAIRRHQSAMLRASTSHPRPAGRLGHREGCMCVICKQARRTGKPWAGMGANGAASQAVWLPQQHPSSKQTTKAPVLRFGKQAYVTATPQLLGGPLRAHIASLPQSHAWTGAEWAASKAPKPALEGTPDPRRSATPEPGSQAKPSRLEHKAAATPAVDISKPDGGSHDEKAAAVVKTEDGEGKGSVPRDAVGLRKREGAGLTLKERLQQCEATEDERITFGKSGIHGWGLFARKHMKQDSMVIEYRGERLRRTVADARERRYRAAGKDCYLFNVNDDIVVDATMKGTKGRFTNHCCAPSMYTKVLDIDGDPRLMFFARTDLVPGQELTYDYRFKEEEGDAKMNCNCGAPNCRGTMN